MPIDACLQRKAQSPMNNERLRSKLFRRTCTSVLPPSSRAMARLTLSSRILTGDSVMNSSTTRSLAPCLFNSFCVNRKRSSASSSASDNTLPVLAHDMIDRLTHLSMVDEAISSIACHRRSSDATILDARFDPAKAKQKRKTHT
jgi:hypothetical protein